MVLINFRSVTAETVHEIKHKQKAQETFDMAHSFLLFESETIQYFLNILNGISINETDFTNDTSLHTVNDALYSRLYYTNLEMQKYPWYCGIQFNASNQVS